ncbi:hypothetical protein ACQWF6_26020, partial [Salmonella enterica subsp. enterica serovar Infantis]
RDTPNKKQKAKKPQQHQNKPQTQNTKQKTNQKQKKKTKKKNQNTNSQIKRPKKQVISKIPAPDGADATPTHNNHHAHN